MHSDLRCGLLSHSGSHGERGITSLPNNNPVVASDELSSSIDVVDVVAAFMKKKTNLVCG